MKKKRKYNLKRQLMKKLKKERQEEQMSSSLIGPTLFNLLRAYKEIGSIFNALIYTEQGNTYHWIQLAKWMEYWQKFSFITSFSKGLIGYSLRYSGEREAAVCISWTVGWGELRECRGGVQREGAEDQANRTTHHIGRRRRVHRLQDRKGLADCWHGGSLQCCLVRILKKEWLTD